MSSPFNLMLEVVLQGLHMFLLAFSAEDTLYEICGNIPSLPGKITSRFASIAGAFSWGSPESTPLPLKTTFRPRYTPSFTRPAITSPAMDNIPLLDSLSQTETAAVSVTNYYQTLHLPSNPVLPDQVRTAHVILAAAVAVLVLVLLCILFMVVKLVNVFSVPAPPTSGSEDGSRLSSSAPKNENPSPAASDESHFLPSLRILVDRVQALEGLKATGKEISSTVQNLSDRLQIVEDFRAAAKELQSVLRTVSDRVRALEKAQEDEARKASEQQGLMKPRLMFPSNISNEMENRLWVADVTDVEVPTYDQDEFRRVRVLANFLKLNLEDQAREARVAAREMNEELDQMSERVARTEAATRSDKLFERLADLETLIEEQSAHHEQEMKKVLERVKAQEDHPKKGLANTGTRPSRYSEWKSQTNGGSLRRSAQEHRPGASLFSKENKKLIIGETAAVEDVEEETAAKIEVAVRESPVLQEEQVEVPVASPRLVMSPATTPLPPPARVPTPPRAPTPRAQTPPRVPTPPRETTPPPSAASEALLAASPISSSAPVAETVPSPCPSPLIAPGASPAVSPPPSPAAEAMPTASSSPSAIDMPMALPVQPGSPQPTPIPSSPTADVSADVSMVLSAPSPSPAPAPWLSLPVTEPADEPMVPSAALESLDTAASLSLPSAEPADLLMVPSAEPTDELWVPSAALQLLEPASSFSFPSAETADMFMDSSAALQLHEPAASSFPSTEPTDMLMDSPTPLQSLEPAAWLSLPTFEPADVLMDSSTGPQPLEPAPWSSLAAIEPADVPIGLFAALQSLEPATWFSLASAVSADPPAVSSAPLPSSAPAPLFALPSAAPTSLPMTLPPAPSAQVEAQAAPSTVHFGDAEASWDGQESAPHMGGPPGRKIKVPRSRRAAPASVGTRPSNVAPSSVSAPPPSLDATLAPPSLQIAELTAESDALFQAALDASGRDFLLKLPPPSGRKIKVPKSRRAALPSITPSSSAATASAPGKLPQSEERAVTVSDQDEALSAESIALLRAAIGASD